MKKDKKNMKFCSFGWLVTRGCCWFCCLSRLENDLVPSGHNTLHEQVPETPEFDLFAIFVVVSNFLVTRSPLPFFLYPHTHSVYSPLFISTYLRGPAIFVSSPFSQFCSGSFSLILPHFLVLFLELFSAP